MPCPCPRSKIVFVIVYVLDKNNWDLLPPTRKGAKKDFELWS